MELKPANQRMMMITMMMKMMMSLNMMMMAMITVTPHQGRLLDHRGKRSKEGRYTYKPNVIQLFSI